MIPFSGCADPDALSGDVNWSNHGFPFTQKGVFAVGCGLNPNRSDQFVGSVFFGPPSPNLAGHKEVQHGENNREPITTDEAFFMHCNEEQSQQLCRQPGGCGYMYFEAAHIYKLNRSMPPFHELAQYAVNKYNMEQMENLDVKKVLKANRRTTFFYMTVEAWDNNTNKDRTFQTIVRVKGSGNFVVGFFKEV